MSRRREATDLARALALSTQPSSSTSLRDSSPPITPLPTKYVPEKLMNGTTSAGGFMDQYHQQLQQAQRYYQQNANPVILAPSSHASRTSYARNTDPRSAPQQPAYGPSGRPSVTSSKPSTSHISDSHRSIVGAISLPDSGYHYPSRSSGLEPTRAQGPPVVHTTTSNQSINRIAPQGLPSSGVKSSLSADSGTQFFIPPGQPQKSPLNSTNNSSSPAIPITANQSGRTPRQTLTGSTPNTSDRSSIYTAPPITPVSSDSRIASFTNSTRSALEPTYKTVGAPPVGQTAGAVTMTSADDIVADSEGEEDVVQGTLDVRDVAGNQVSGSDLGGMHSGLPTPSLTGTTPAPQSTSSVVPSIIPLQPPTIKAIPSKEPFTSALGQDTTGSKSVTPAAPVSTRPKPKRKVKPPTESASVDNAGVATSTTSVHPQSTVSTPVLPQSTVTTDAQRAPVVVQPLAESSKQNPEIAKKAPVKTYGSNNKDTAPSAKASRSTDVQDEKSSRKGNASKRRNVVGSDSELSDAGGVAGDSRRGNKNPGKVAKEDMAEAPISAKRTGKKRAIIASDDETEEEELHTPDSKRRKPNSDGRQIPKEKTSRPRDSSIDPLDLDMDNGFSGKSGRVEVSIEMSPASVIDLQSSMRAPAAVETSTSVKIKTKSPNKVHFVDPPMEEEEPVAKQPVSKSKKSKSVTRMDDAYDEVPEFAAPVEDEDDEDDFMPSGSKKAKAKAKATKAKKATAAKEKAVKGKKATQAKGKKGKAVEPIQPSVTEESVVEPSGGPTVSGVIYDPTTDNAIAPVSTIPDVIELPLNAPAKAKPKRIVVVGKKAPKSAEIIEDEEVTTPKATADVVVDSEPVTAPALDELDAATQDTAQVTGRGTQGKKVAAKKKVVESDVESEKEVEKDTTPPVVAQPSEPETKILQAKASLVVNPPAAVKLEPSFVVDKNGNVKEFRTCRTDLPKVVQTTGGVKRIGFSRRSAIPSLHKNFKAPPKRLPPPPKKPSRKKEDSDDDSDEFDENGKKKIRPGDPEWYMMDVD